RKPAEQGKVQRPAEIPHIAEPNRGGVFLRRGKRSASQPRNKNQRQGQKASKNCKHARERRLTISVLNPDRRRHRIQIFPVLSGSENNFFARKSRQSSRVEWRHGRGRKGLRSLRVRQIDLQAQKLCAVALCCFHKASQRNSFRAEQSALAGAKLARAIKHGYPPDLRASVFAQLAAEQRLHIRDDVFARACREKCRQRDFSGVIRSDADAEIHERFGRSAVGFIVITGVLCAEKLRRKHDRARKQQSQRTKFLQIAHFSKGPHTQQLSVWKGPRLRQM